ncbi:MAG: caspase family protein [Gemmatimonadaceae bacterium]
MRDNHAIVVGLTRYPGMTDLEGPENDARWFYDWLIANKQVTKKNAQLIVTSRFPAKKSTTPRQALPGTAEIDCAFERLLEIGGDQGRVGERLYLFFSGHGFCQTLDDAALLMSNSDIKHGVTGHHVNAVTYANFFAMSAYFDEVVLFMDCCRDDYWRAPSRALPWQSIREVDGADVKRFYALATKWNQKAREAMSENGKVHGHFTRALQAALEGAAVDGQGQLTTKGVMDVAINYVHSVIGPELRAKHLPRVEPCFPVHDDFILATNQVPGTTTATIHFGRAAAATCAGFVLIGGDPPSVTTNVDGANPWIVKVSTGRYCVLRPDGKTVAGRFDAFGGQVDVNV